MKEPQPEQIVQERKDATTCMAIGASVGVLGAASAVLAGAVCPLCFFVAPGLIGVGAYKRAKASKKLQEIDQAKRS